MLYGNPGGGGSTMVHDSRIDDRSLIEDAMTLVLAEAPAGWTRVVAQFEPSWPPTATAYATTGSSPAPVAVPPGAVELVSEYRRRSETVRGRTVVEVDHTGALSMHTDAPSTSNSGRPQIPAPAGPRARRLGGMAVWFWAIAAIAAIGVLVVAIVGRDRGDGPTLRAMAASEAMSDEQARTVAANTVRGWVRERNQRHLANLEALSCSDSLGTVAAEIAAIKNDKPAPQAIDVVALGAFARHGAVWTLNTHFNTDQNHMFVLEVRDGELLVCAIASAPVP